MNKNVSEVQALSAFNVKGILKLEAACSSETLGFFYRPTSYKSEHHNDSNPVSYYHPTYNAMRLALPLAHK
jgi:hypothetical protein